MEALAVQSPWVSPEEYLAAEAVAEGKSEYCNGEVVAMAGAAAAHDLIAVELLISLGQHLRGHPCAVYSSDMRVEAINLVTHAYFYPDVTVSCETVSRGQTQLQEPRAIFEVLSPSTAQRDWELKRRAYCSLPSVEVYGVVATDSVAATLFRRTPTNWVVEDLVGPEAILQLPSLGFAVPLGELYRRVPPVTPPVAPSAAPAAAPSP